MLFFVPIELHNRQFTESSHWTRAFAIIKIGESNDWLERNRAILVLNCMRWNPDVVPIFTIATGVKRNCDFAFWQLQFRARAN